MTDAAITPGLLLDVTHRVHPDEADAFRALAARMAAAANERDGCAFLKVAQDILDPTTFHLIEGWRDQDALDAHVASDAFQEVLGEAGKLRIASRFACIYAVTGARRIGMPS